MHFGIHIFPTESSIQPDELAREAEARGLESLWFSEHTHIPVRFLEAPGRGPTLPAYYWQTYDIFIAMALAAAVTTRLKLGSGVSLVPEHHPINLAKSTATIDVVSRGRFIFGVGVGWNEAEMNDHGVVYRTRYQLLRDALRAILQIWTEPEAAYHGRFVSFDKMKEYPKPYQRPHPPIIMGGSHDKALQLAAELCDGWAPWGMPWDTAKDMIPRLRQLAVQNNRDPASLAISMYDKTLPDAATLDQMQTASVERFILTIYDQPRDQALTSLDSLSGPVSRYSSA